MRIPKLLVVVNPISMTRLCYFSVSAFSFQRFVELFPLLNTRRTSNYAAASYFSHSNIQSPASVKFLTGGSDEMFDHYHVLRGGDLFGAANSNGGSGHLRG